MPQHQAPYGDSDERRLLLNPETPLELPISPWSQPDDQSFLGLTRTAWFCIALTLFLELSNAILAVPTLSLYERVICDNYYQSRGGLFVPPVDAGDPCKLPLIQSELALVRGWQSFFNGVSALLVALPMGYLADHCSHRKVFALILGGMVAAILWTILVCAVQAMPVRLVWLTSVFYLCGGGNYAAEMLLATMLVRASTEHDRTRNLYYMYSAFIFTELVGPPVARSLVKLSIWLPFGLGVAFLCICFVLLSLVPGSARDAPQRGAPLATADGDPAPKARSVLYMRLTEIWAQFGSRNMYLALPMFYAGTFRNVSVRALLQYVHARLGWDLPEANFLITEVALVNLLLFFLVLPTVIIFCNRTFNPHPQSLNLAIIRGSFAVLVVGCILLAVSTTSAQLLLALAFYACGFGARSTLLSLVTSWFEPAVRTRVYSAILLIELIGLLTWEPLLQNLLALSFTLPKFWMGLPFLVCAAGYLVATTSSWMIRLDITSAADGEEPRSTSDSIHR